MNPLTEAIHKAVAQFTDNHQSLSMLMVNTLVAIVEGKVGPLFKAERERLTEMPRYAETPTPGHIIRRCEKCSGLMEVPTQLCLVQLVGCRACVAEARLLTVSEKLIAAEKERDDWKALYVKPSQLFVVPAAQVTP